MSSYDAEKAEYILDKGNYIIRVGNSSDNAEAVAVIVLEKDVTVEKLKNICPVQDFENMKFSGYKQDDVSKLKKLVLNLENIKTKTVKYSGEPKEIPQNAGCLWEDVINGSKTVDDFIGGLDEKQLIYLCMGLFDENGSMDSMIGIASNSGRSGGGNHKKA